MNFRGTLNGAVTLALLLPIPAFALTFGTWNFAGSNGWTDGGSSGGTLKFIPTAGGGVDTFVFTNTIDPGNNERITASSSGWQNLTVTGGNATVTFRVSGNTDPSGGNIDPLFLGASNQFTGTGPLGTVSSNGLLFTGGNQRTLTVTISFSAGSAHSVPVSPSSITVNFTN